MEHHMDMAANITLFNSTIVCAGSMPGDYCDNNTLQSRGGHATQFYALNLVDDILNIIVTPTLCIFGCIGNMINLVVLAKIRVRIQKVNSSKEGVTHLGLILLAISDLLFCLCTCPRGFEQLASMTAFFKTRSFGLYYQVYGTGLTTMFILTSTWITVAMAVLRYVGICHPLTTRHMDSHVYGRVAYTVVIIISLLINMPTFWQFKIQTLEIGPGQNAYLVDIGFFDYESRYGRAFLWVRAFYSVFIPAALLAFCNMSLILTLRKSYQMRRVCRVPESASRNSSRITLLLVVLMVMFVLLVFPSELMNFCMENIRLDVQRTQAFLIIRSFANVLQVLNFTVNFVLYCALNVHFRSATRDMFFCCCSNSESSNRSLMGRSMIGSSSMCSTTFSITRHHATEPHVSHVSELSGITPVGIDNVP